ncbi:MAG: uracil-DNA glycosylase [Clostridium sp.]|uniref:uracil-DNA glycosylase n=1 Tax=Clostridium culturomicium TaxID=1499683 RepID=UPI00058DF61B|nr:uracil-DNA glycosylase [Clostridium culturomicium]MDU4891110.1 uracil-DNA glycosylase [Clostridium sp.]MDU7085507.1 uracil-DNA glycosylase [Clostridium sp.]
MVKLGNSWDGILTGEFEKPYYLKLKEFLTHEYKTKVIYPDKYNIFNALKLTPYEEVKVVILGQDPYHGPGQAHGLSFSVQPGIQTPPSLQNMYKELRDDLGCFIPNNGYLVPWAQQGVLLLNTVLTVEAGKANSHRKKGWENFTDEVIKKLNERDKPIVFLLWGNNAKEKMNLITNPNHFILTTVHPSPLSATRGFMGCKHFSKTNEILKELGEKEINWQIPNL